MLWASALPSLYCLLDRQLGVCSRLCQLQKNLTSEFWRALLVYLKCSYLAKDMLFILESGKSDSLHF